MKPNKHVIQQLFGKSLEQIRKEKGISRYLLAKRLGYQITRITQIENGKSDIRLSSIIAFSEALDILPGDLLNNLVQLSVGQNDNLLL